jgi:hypothetical protein
LRVKVSLATMVVDAAESAVGMAVDPAACAGLALQRKAVPSQGGDEFPYRGIAEEVDELARIVGHKVTATTGTSIVSTAFTAGMRCPFSTRTSR